jgi:DUF1680 family protein
MLETNYPFENTLKYTINSKKDFEFEIRLPQDAKNIVVNGQSVTEHSLYYPITQNKQYDFVQYAE